MFWKEDVGVVSKLTDSENEFMWTFPNGLSYDKFNSDNENRQCVLCSPLFSFFKIKWRLVLIRHTFDASHEKLGLFLWKISSTNCLPRVTVELSTISSDYGKTAANGELNLQGCFGRWNFIDSSFIYGDYGYSDDGFLRVFCKFLKKENEDKNSQKCADGEKIHESDVSRNEEIVSEEEITSDEENDDNKKLLSKDKGIKILLENLKQALHDGRMSDVVLKVDSREFNVHSMILVSRSPVFASMFQHDMKEKKDNVVDIPDCTAESFEVFLEYLYTGSAEALSTDNVYNVYYAADKYRVDDLKEKCVRFMSDTISVETFCDVITLSLCHGEAKLQKRATDFFCANIKKIIKTVQWQTYLDKNSTHANELLIKALDA